MAQYESGRAEEPVPEWILPPASCQLLRDLASLFPEPPKTFEFGSGRSTGILRSVSAGTTSVEHSASWLAETEKTDDKRPFDETAVLPLRRCWNRFRLIESFSLLAHPRILNALRGADLILVDSPPNPAKREHALFQALHFAPRGAIVVLDDLEVRATARFSQRLARQNARAFQFWKVNIDHQLGLFLKRHSGRLRSWPSPREFVGTWLRA